MASGLQSGAQKTSVLLQKGSTKLKDQITPDEKEAEIDPRIKKGVYYTKQATGVAVKVSGYIGMFLFLFIYFFFRCRKALAIMTLHSARSLTFSKIHSGSLSNHLCMQSISFSCGFPLLLLSLIFPVVTKCSSPYLLILWPKNFACLFLMLLQSVLAMSILLKTSSTSEIFNIRL